MTEPTTSPVDTDALRAEYRRLMRMAARETFDKDEAIELVHVCLELGKLGYTLTPDESDWLPPTVNEETDNG